MTRLLTFLISIILILPAYAQDYEKKLDEFLFTELGKLNIPNVEISVVSSDTILYSRSLGVKKSDSALFYLGSVSKSLTALAVLKLIESGKLHFESKLSDIIPEINYNEYASEITVRHLLNHTSGIKKISGFENLPTLNELSSLGFSLMGIEEPGNRHVYSNLNYSLLGLVIERSSGMSYSEFMSFAVFRPLQMQSSRIYKSVQLNHNVVNQYQYWGPFPIKSEQVKYSETAVPAGFILSNAGDMSNYLSMMLAHGKYKNEKFIDPQLLTQMTSPWDNSELGYCMGWKKGSYNQKVIFQHLGSTATSYSAIFIIPELNIGFTILTNTNSLSYTEDITEEILNILTGGEVKKSDS